MDDLLDLDWDRKPASSSGLQSSARSANTNGSSYNFDALTRSLPQTKPMAPASRSIPAASLNATTRQQHNSTVANSDAFSSLLGFDSGSSAASSKTISMAERLKRERLGATSPQSTTPQQSSTPTDTAWEGLDSFLGASQKKAAPAKATSHPQRASAAADEDLWNFNPKEKNSIKQAAKTEKVEKAASKIADPFDFSEFEDPGSSQSSALESAVPQPRQQGPRHDRSQPADDSDEDDDLLGSLKSVKPAAREPLPIGRKAAAPARSNGSASPPPHIIGQIVEMGFSPTQARQALAATQSGLDVSAALEMLLEEQRAIQPAQEDLQESDHKMAKRLQREEERRRPDRQTANRTGTPEGSVKVNGIEVPQEWQKQADQIYSQASEIGASMFSKANALWSTAKAQAQKALDERNMGAESGQSSGRSSPATGSERAKSRRWAVPSRDGGNHRKEWQGKPKWMVDAENEADTSAEQVQTQSSFKDDADVRDEAPAKPFIQRETRTEKKDSHLLNPLDLWESGDANGSSSIKPTASAPTSRRSSPLATGAGSSRQSPVPRKAAVATTKPVQVEHGTHRHMITDDAGAIQSSLTLKQRGNELFKQGAYIEAEVAYTNALNSLQAASLRKVALFNNRASARLKNGDARNALSDTKEVLTLIVMTESGKGSPFLLYRPSKEYPLPLPEYADINLRDGYAKALLRRAQAEEMLEQWETAQSVWSLLERYEKEEGSGKSGMTNLRAAQEGGKRCNTMLRGGDVVLTPPATQRVRAAAVQAIAKAERLAKERIRSENAIAAKEEAEKDSLRDNVDNRVATWKNNKETNVRALLASLHEVVWPGLGWKKVGMHELVMDNQVKKCYMRAIGKLHPDKLTPKTNTIEERMVGGAVFSVLNDAWSSANAS